MAARRILLPIDREAGAERLLVVAGHLARSQGATVRLLHVAPAPDDLYEQQGAAAYVDEAMARLEAEATARLRRLARALGGVPFETVVRFGDPATGILREAASADLLVLGASGADAPGQPGLDGVAREVCRRAPVPVLVYRTEGPPSL